MRAATDVSADADPNSGAQIYDSTPYSNWAGWFDLGGTSLAAPMVASMYILAGGVPAGVNAQQVPYSTANGTNAHDVTVGYNGTCSTIMCTTATGYDGPTGLGTPNGVNAFNGAGVVPPGPTVSPTVTVIHRRPPPRRPRPPRRPQQPTLRSPPTSRWR
jgi:hypothetical protein